MLENNYYSIACNDYRYPLHNLDSEFYNNMAIECHQICEKALKSVLVYISPDAKEALSSNNLKQIYNAINEERKIIELDIAKLSLLKDCLEVKYPGDNFTNISREEFEMAYLTVMDVLNEVNKWRAKHNLEVEVPSKSLKTKQALLENVLDMWLTQKQIEAIETGWNAFYSDPMQYKNSVVVDMVKLFLQEV